MAERNYVTIVSGLPRSGTSMMMQMIDKGGIPAMTDHVRTADEDNPKGYYEFEPVKKTKEDSTWVAEANGKAVKMTHLLLMDMPLDYTYRVVFMRRHLKEVVKSQNVMLERRGKDTDSIPRERLIDMFRVQIHKVLTYMQDRPDHFQYIEIDYNAIMKDPEPHIKQISAFLDGLNTDEMLAVVDPALYRNRLVE